MERGMRPLVRRFSQCAKLASEVKPAFAGGIAGARGRAKHGDGFVPLSDNLKTVARTKAWERAGMSKDEFFRQKYAHVHADQKKRLRDRPRDKSRDKPKNKMPEGSRARFIKNAEAVERRGAGGAGSSVGLDFGYDKYYGTSVVLALLKQGKRQFKNLYISSSKGSSDGKQAQLAQIKKLVVERDVNVVRVESKFEMSKLSRGNVHNGVVLEATALEVNEIKTLPAVEEHGVLALTEYAVDEQTLEPAAVQREVPLRRGKPFPVVVFVDGVSDPHNLGAIIRSCYFLGADLVVASSNNTSALSPAVAKASSGAVELMPLARVKSALKFFDSCKRNGWAVVSSDVNSAGQGAAEASAVEVDENSEDQLVGNEDEAGDDADLVEIEQEMEEYARAQARSNTPFIDLQDLPSLAQQGPVLLVLGSEGQGVRKALADRSDFLVEIPGCDDLDPLVDSLNVSVASALLVQRLLER